MIRMITTTQEFQDLLKTEAVKDRYDCYEGTGYSEENCEPVERIFLDIRGDMIKDKGE